MVNGRMGLAGRIWPGLGGRVRKVGLKSLKQGMIVVFKESKCGIRGKFKTLSLTCDNNFEKKHLKKTFTPAEFKMERRRLANYRVEVNGRKCHQ